MDHDFASPDRIDGCPSFVRRSGEGIDWWAPVRTGDEERDLAAGRAHFEAALSLLHGCTGGNFYAAFGSPLELNHHCFLPDILAGMREIGPMERGFLEALVQKAIVGRVPPSLPDTPWMTPSDRTGEDLAQLYLLIGQDSASFDLLLEEIICVLEEACGKPRAFVWTVCMAASSGGRH